MQDGDGSFNMPAFPEGVLSNYVHVVRVDEQYLTTPNSISWILQFKKSLGAFTADMMMSTVSLCGEDVNYKDEGYNYITNNDNHIGAMSEAIIKIPEDIKSSKVQTKFTITTSTIIYQSPVPGIVWANSCNLASITGCVAPYNPRGGFRVYVQTGVSKQGRPHKPQLALEQSNFFMQGSECLFVLLLTRALGETCEF